MRITTTFSRLNGCLSTEIRRQYPLVYNERLNHSFNQLTLPENLEGNLAKVPYIEALPQYKMLSRGTYDSGLEALADEEWLGPNYRQFVDFMKENRVVGGNNLFFDPYEHQGQALKAWSKGADFVVSTGTGSGKTECFLWPIAGHLHDIAERAKEEPGEHRGIKAMILYPMNALVADQLKRLRTLFGSQRVAANLAGDALIQGGEIRPFQFGQYTGRTKFHGSYAKSGTTGSVNPKVPKAKKQFRTFCQIYEHPTTSTEEPDRLYQQMMDKGLIPSKGPDHEAHGKLHWNMNHFHDHTVVQDNYGLITQPGDRELYYRHEMHNTGYSNLRDTQTQGGNRRITPQRNGGGTPDILVTNYSMLEYMLKRPLEHGIFAETKEWVHAAPENKLMFVLDEAHLYQGALGTEIGLLVRRLLSSLGILGDEHSDKVQFIMTSASLGTDESSREKFVHGLTGRPRESSGTWSYEDVKDVNWGDNLDSSTVFIGGTKWKPEQVSDEAELSEIREFLLSLPYDSENDPDDFLRPHFADRFGAPEDDQDLTIWLRDHALFRTLYWLLLDGSMSLDDLSNQLLGNESDIETRRKCMESILNFVACLKGPRPDADPERNLPLLGIRAHLLYRGLPRLYWNLTRHEILLREENTMETSYPIRGCRRCGAPYVSIWIHRRDFDDIAGRIESIDEVAPVTVRTFSRPVDHSLRLEVYLYDEYDDNRGQVTVGTNRVIADGPPHVWVNTESYQLQAGGPRPGNSWLPGHLPSNIRQQPTDPLTLCDPRDDDDNAGRYRVQEVTFCQARCLQCQTLHMHRRKENPQITDYMTKGDDPFSRLMGELIRLQTPVEASDHLPNKGKKVLAFSDSRSRAAQLAKNIQDNINYDELRSLVLHLTNQPWYESLPEKCRSLEYLYPTFVLHMSHAQLEPFASTGDEERNTRNSFAYSRINVLAAHAANLYNHKEDERVSRHDELMAVIAYCTRDLPEETRAETVNSNFHKSASRTADWSAQAAASQYWRNRSHRAYILAVRKEWTRALTVGGVVNTRTASALTPREKRLLFGVLFDHTLHDENNVPNTNRMREILTGLGLTFDNSENLEPNPFARYQAILEGGAAAMPDILRNSRFSEDIKHRQRMTDIRDARSHRLNSMRAKFDNPDWRRFELASAWLQTSPWTLKQLSNLAGQIISVVCTSDLLDSQIQIRKHWDGVQERGLLSNGVPYDFSGAIADFIGSTDFSLSGIGLGYAGVNPGIRHSIRAEFSQGEPELQEQFDNHWESGFNAVLSELIHWITRPSLGDQDSGQGKERRGGERCIQSPSGSFTYNSMKYGRGGRWIKHENWGIDYPRIQAKYESLCQQKFAEPPTIPFGSVADAILLSPANDEAPHRMVVNTRAVELFTTLNDNQLLACHRCGLTMPIIDEDLQPRSCLNCNFEDIQPYDFAAHQILHQRIESPWRAPTRTAIESPVGDLEVLVIRAEEHTAQINNPKGDEEMYTPAEEFELLFQDIPFVVPKEDDVWSLAQAPVDLLSCTTTMEVGIDIGSLTCVALRTIPRKNSNYQQRVGRAGRGSAEVCVAVSWCDNQPHAQNNFENPETMLSHPDNSPVIYLDNKSIISRHVNAAIFQSFFKRMNYDIPNRRFPAMGERDHEKNLMESMGELEEFFSTTNETPFSYISFVSWLNGDPLEDENPDMSWEQIRPQIEGLIPIDSELDFDELKDDLENFLNETSNILQARLELVE